MSIRGQAGLRTAMTGSNGTLGERADQPATEDVVGDASQIPSSLRVAVAAILFPFLDAFGARRWASCACRSGVQSGPGGDRLSSPIGANQAHWAQRTTVWYAWCSDELVGDR